MSAPDPNQANLQAAPDPLRDAVSAGREAAARGDYLASARALEAAVAVLSPGDDEEARVVYELLGIAYFSADLPKIAARAFLRALDGDLASRERALRYLVLALAAEGRSQDALSAMTVYEQAVGPFPGGVTSRMLREVDEETRHFLSKVHPC